jgi:hypothetical protein
MENYSEKTILILAKTYPTPSKKYIETCCTAGITDNGMPIRIYPIPFRRLSESRHYSKWQWIKARVAKNPKDSRVESYKIDVYSIEPIKKESKADWASRIPWIKKFPKYSSLGKLSADGKAGICSLAYMKPDKILDLEIEETNSKWTEEELKSLTAQSNDLLSDLPDELHQIRTVLESIPYGFYYRFTVDGEEQRAKIIDWEICQLYRNLCRDKNWKEKIRDKYLREFGTGDLYFLMGNQHRFRNQFLIISVAHVPQSAVTADSAEHQLDLF